MSSIFDKDLTGKTRTGTAGAIESQEGTSTPPETFARDSTQISSFRMPGIVGPIFQEEEVQAPPSNQIEISADLSDDVDQDGNSGGFTSHSVGVQGTTIYREWNRFDLSDIGNIPVGSNITGIELEVNDSFRVGNDADTCSVTPYNGDGQADPNADAGADQFDRCDIQSSGGGYIVGSTQLRTTGVKIFTLGQEAIQDILTAYSAVGRFAICFKQDDESTAIGSHYAVIDGYSLSSPPKLRIFYSESVSTARGNGSVERGVLRGVMRGVAGG